MLNYVLFTNLEHQPLPRSDLTLMINVTVIPLPITLVDYFILYHIIALFGPCAYSRKTFGELIENAGAPILSVLQLTSMCLYLSRGACSLRGAYAKA